MQYIVNKFKYQGSVKNLQRKPKQRKLNKKEEKHIVREIKRNSRINSQKLCQLVQFSTGKNIFNETVRQVLHRHGYHGRVPWKRPLVSRKNKLLRLKFIKEHVNKGHEFWNKVIWSD